MAREGPNHDRQATLAASAGDIPVLEALLAQHRAGRDFAAVGKLLLAAGSPVEWETGAEPAEGILEIVEQWRRN